MADPARPRRVEGQAQGDEALLTRTIDHCEEALRSMAVIAMGDADSR